MTNYSLNVVMWSQLLLGLGDSRSIPRWLRRAVLLTFPVSWPLLIAIQLPLLVLMILEAGVRTMIDYARDMWS